MEIKNVSRMKEIAQTIYLVLSSLALIGGGALMLFSSTIPSHGDVRDLVQKEKRATIQYVDDKHQEVVKILERIDGRVWEMYKNKK